MGGNIALPSSTKKIFQLGNGTKALRQPRGNVLRKCRGNRGEGSLIVHTGLLLARRARGAIDALALPSNALAAVQAVDADELALICVAEDVPAHHTHQ
jgi:hypothetical protein